MKKRIGKKTAKSGVKGYGKSKRTLAKRSKGISSRSKVKKAPPAKPKPPKKPR